MADEIFFDGIRFVPLDAAAKSAGRTREYLMRQCRDGAVSARRVGKSWYVEPASLEAFVVKQDEARAEHYREIARKRAAEYGAQAGTTPAHVAALAASLPKYFSLKDAAARAGLTGEYLAALCRSGKLPAKRVGDTWYLESSPFYDYVLTREHTRALRYQTMSHARAEERRAHQPPATLSSAEYATPFATIIETTSALMLAVLIAFGSYTAMSPNGARTLVADVQRTFQITPERIQSAAANAAAGGPMSAAQSLARSWNRAVDALIYGVMFPPRMLADSGPKAAVGVKIVSGERSSVQTAAAATSTSPTPVRAVYAPPVRQTVSQTIVNNPVIERVIEKQRVVIEGGLTEEMLSTRLNQLDNSLSSKMYSLSSANSTAISDTYHAVTLTNRIDELASVDISGSTFANGTVTNSDITGGTIKNSSISDSSIGATSLTASGDTGLATTSATAFTAVGATTTSFAVLGVGTSTFAGGIAVSGGCVSVNGTCIGSSNAATAGSDMEVQFNNGGALGASPSFTFSSSTNVLTVTNTVATNATTTNATTTNFFATSANFTNATSTNFFATNASTTNATSTNLFAAISSFTSSVISTLTAAAATITDLIATTLTTTNLVATNATTTNATSTNLFTTNLTATNATFTGATSTSFFSATASSTSLYAQAASVGTLAASGAATLSSTLNVTGLTTLGSLSLTAGTTTSFFSTIASSTNLYAQSASLGALTASTFTTTGLSTFSSGFLSNASSTITSGLFSMNGGASTTNFTASGTSYFGTIIPLGSYTNNLSAYDLGATGSRWNALWAGTVNVGTSTFSLKSDANSNLGIFTAAGGGGTQALTITQGGNVGIGTTNPQVVFSGLTSGTTQRFGARTRANGEAIGGLATGQVADFGGFYSTATAPSSAISFGAQGATGGQGAIGFLTSPTDTLSTEPTMRMVITKDGNVGIGTTSPDYKLVAWETAADTHAMRIVSSMTSDFSIGVGGGLMIDDLNNTSSAKNGILFRGTDDGNAFRHAGGILFGKDGAWVNGSGLYPAYISFWTRSGTSNEDLERMRITSAGNVGIGTTTPTHPLSVLSSGLTTQARFSNGGATGGLYLLGGGTSNPSGFWIGGGTDYNGSWTARGDTEATILAANNGIFTFYSNSGLTDGSTYTPTARVSIDASGNVGIGDTSPNTKLVVKGPNETSRGTLQLISSDSDSTGITFYSQTGASVTSRNWRVGTNWSTSGNFEIHRSTAAEGTPSTAVLAIDGSGNVGIGTASPAYFNSVSSPQTQVTQIKGALLLGGPGQAANDGGFLQLGDAAFVSGNSWGWLGAFGQNMAVKSDTAADTWYTPVAHANLGYRGIGWTSDKNLNFYNYDGATIAGATITPTPRMVIDKTGNIGIGQTVPVSLLTVQGGSAAWDTTTPGTTPGSIHLDPGNTSDNYGSAITWGASDTGSGDTAQAGIYVRSDSTYGTSMFLGTTDAYVSGAKSRMAILYNGNVGVASTSPNFKFVVNGSVAFQGITTIGAESLVPLCWKSTTSEVKRSTVVNTCDATDGDVAEYYGTEEPVVRGEIVSLGTTVATRPFPVMNHAPGEASTTMYAITTAKVRKATATDRSRIIGAVPTAPFTIGSDVISPVDNPQTVALVGHVPIKMTLDGGDVSIGDAITVSDSMPGWGMKATSSGRIIGFALEDFSAASNSEDGMIEVYVKPQDWIAPQDFAALLDLSAFGAAATTTSVSSDSFVGRLLTNMISRVQNWLADAGNGITDIFAKNIRATNVYADTVQAKKLCLDDVCVTKAELAALLAVSGGMSQEAGSTSGSSDAGGANSSPDSTLVPPDSPSDSEAPVITINGLNPATLNVGDAYNDLGALVADDTDENLGYSVFVDGATSTPNNISLDTSAVGTHTIVYSATDQAGNTGTATRLVNVVSPVDSITAAPPLPEATADTASTTPVEN